MASSSDLTPIRKTVDALKEIRKQIGPFLRVLELSQSDEASVDPQDVAEAKTCLALAIGTLRHMGARLGGKGGGGSGKKNDPLRLELDRMRKMLVTLRKTDKHGSSSSGGPRSATGASSSSNSSQSQKQKQNKQMEKEDKATRKQQQPQQEQEQEREGKVIDIPVSKRLIDAALAGNNKTQSTADQGRGEKYSKRKRDSTDENSSSEKKSKR